MNYSDVLANARQCIGKYCKACPVCNGVACKNQIPGPGAKGVGDTAIRNYNKWADIRVNMDTLCENGTPDTHVELFGRSFKYPFFAGPVGAVNLHYSDTYTDMTYNDVLVRACAESGIAAFTGDGTNPDVMTMATKAIGNADGCGVPTIKPWNIDTIKEKMAQAKASGCFAVAMDIDAAGLPFLKNMNPPAGSKTVDSDTADAIAYYLANAVGSTKPDHIVLTDTKGNLLFNGQQDAGLGGTISSTEDYRDKLKNNFAKYVRDLLTKAGYDDVEVSKNDLFQIAEICKYILDTALLQNYEEPDEGRQMVQDLLEIIQKAMTSDLGLVSIGD